MAAKVYTVPKEVNLPEIDFSNFNRKEYDQKIENFISELRSHIKKLGYTGKNSGEIIQFQVADGYAQYMVLSMKPLQFIHLEIDDAWTFQYIHLLTAKEVNEKISQQKAFKKLFK